MEPKIKMDAGLLALACSGSSHDLESLLNRTPAAYTIGSSATQPASVYGVTIGGDTLLHVVAAGHGDSEDLLNKASLLYSKAPNLLFVQNNDGDTPLHCAARAGNIQMVSLLIDLANGQGINNAKGLLEAQNKLNETALHEAVRSGNNDIVKLLMAHDPELATLPIEGTSPLYLAVLLENGIIAKTLYELSVGVLSYSGPNGQNALHAAVLRGKVEKMKICTVHFACNSRSLSWILNMQDNDGNSALHLAIQIRNLKMFCALLGNIQVNLNLTNKKGETPFDIARCNLITTKGLHSNKKSEAKILQALRLVDAKSGICRGDYLEGKKEVVQARQNGTSKMENVKEGTQSLCIGAVLIATVTFGASFTMPGGYRSDGHTSGGTPTLAGRFAFDAFMLANSLAFTFSMIATIALMSSGSPMHNPQSRELHFGMAFGFLSISITGLVAAFALSTYTMLAPVAHKTAIVVCVMSSLILLYQNCELAIKNSLLAPPLCRRKGIFRARVWTFPLTSFTFLVSILLNLWPIVVILCLTALSYTRGKVELAAQPATPHH
ncbi:ankyrin repeat-containing protein At5g02620-like [Triticum aestivum]|uniref:ankyrin repeat-containing protein At5g02620-like n=1 Tax=Triticum aestivum TaxID=4565 RepID=UPI001D00441B|nr:ankyrin repeat-containing protein At5g02620-like [Triticum aestivum]